MTFATIAYKFYKSLEFPVELPKGILVMNPYKDKNTLQLVESFLNKYFLDSNKRIFVFGINPGRLGGGYSGINFTDGYALEHYCRIENNLSKRRELSSDFIYNFINYWGGAYEFYRHFFMTAVSPLGFLKNGLNYNYYDDKEFIKKVKGFVAKSIEKQLKFGAYRKAAILFGTGKNQKFFNSLNNEFGFFDKVYPLEHPRFIMQYRRKNIKEYLEKYLKTFKNAMGQ